MGRAFHDQHSLTELPLPLAAGPRPSDRGGTLGTTTQSVHAGILLWCRLRRAGHLRRLPVPLETVLCRLSWPLQGLGVFGLSCFGLSWLSEIFIQATWHISIILKQNAVNTGSLINLSTNRYIERNGEIFNRILFLYFWETVKRCSFLC